MRTFSALTFSQSEKNLTEDMSTVQEYLSKWRLKLSTNKTVCSVFHIRNHHAGYQLKVESSPGKLLPFQNNPTYLGITLDRSLTFKDHILKLKNKVSSRVALIKCLTGLTWGCSFKVLRTSTSALVCVPAEYCSQAWCQSAHARKLDTQLNEAMRTVSDSIRSTYFQN